MTTSPASAPCVTPSALRDALERTTAMFEKNMKNNVHHDGGADGADAREGDTPGMLLDGGEEASLDGYEAIGGRVRAADGTWIAWELVRPSPRPGRARKAPLLVTVNGLSNDGFQWRGRVMDVLRKDHAVLSWDYRGHGCSEDPKDVARVSIEALAEDMEAVMLDVSARSLASTLHVTVVAYSMGCQVALEWCRSSASRVAGIALVLGTPQHSLDSILGRTVGNAAAALMDGCPKTFAFLWDCFSAVSFMTSLVGHTLARALGVINVPWRDFAPFYRHMKRLHGGAYARMVVSGQRHSAADVLEHLDRREVPTLIVTGGRDFSVSRAVGHRMHALAPRARFVHLANACHAGMIGERESVAAALARFLQEMGQDMAFNRERVFEATGMESPADTPPKDPYGFPIE